MLAGSSYRSIANLPIRFFSLNQEMIAYVKVGHAAPSLGFGRYFQGMWFSERWSEEFIRFARPPQPPRLSSKCIPLWLPARYGVQPGLGRESLYIVTMQLLWPSLMKAVRNVLKS